MTEEQMKDEARADLSKREDDLRTHFDHLNVAREHVDQQAIERAKDYLATAFMWAKRALYEGKRVGD